MDKQHDAIILSKPFLSISEANLSGTYLSRNLHWISFDNLSSAWSLSSTQIWPELNSWVVFSAISIQWCCMSSVHRGASIKGRIDEMSDDSSGNGTEPMQSKH